MLILSVFNDWFYIRHFFYFPLLVFLYFLNFLLSFVYFWLTFLNKLLHLDTISNGNLFPLIDLLGLNGLKLFKSDNIFLFEPRLDVFNFKLCEHLLQRWLLIEWRLSCIHFGTGGRSGIAFSWVDRSGCFIHLLLLLFLFDLLLEMVQLVFLHQEWLTNFYAYSPSILCSVAFALNLLFFMFIIK